uniref:Major facilitator superfamily (MFS) profile domain-containing protein n=1 Tax=Oryza nivara TaxID=4536 RepID=A0A0E0HE13_ORYNI
MKSDRGEIQELPRPTPPPPPQNTGDKPLTTEETKEYHKGCPGCQLEKANESRTGIPYLNFFYICIIGITSSLPIQSLFPYQYFMIRDMNIAKREEDIGLYAGFVAASYFLARTFSSVPWGISVDKYGRKPCIVISILSVIFFNTLFGLSTRYWMAIVTRGMLGMLCGILGPIKAYATEICRKEHQALGMSLVTSSRAVAFVLGPAIGGFLAQKSTHIFSPKNPYLGDAQISEEVEAQVDLSNIESGKAKVSSDTSLKNLLKNWKFVSSVIIYCTFSLHDVAYLETFSFWAVSKRKFRGLNLTSQDLATVSAISGIGVLVYQFTVYPFIAKYFGPIRPLRPTAILSVLLLTAYPYMHNLHGLELKATITTACNILQNTAVTQKQRGAANGISVTLLSLFQGLAPAGAGILFSWSQKHVTGLFLPGGQILFLVISMVAVIGLILTFKPFFSMSDALSRS